MNNNTTNTTPNNPMSSNKRILIIDDDQEIWQAYQNVLASGHALRDSQRQILQLLQEMTEEDSIPPDHDFHLSFAAQGQEGFHTISDALAHNSPYAVAFVDIRMPPGWDGVTTASKIRAIDQNIEIVIVTAFSDFSHQQLVQSVGTPEKLLYLKKPFDAEELSQIALSLTEKWNINQHEQQYKQEINRLLGQLQHSEYYLKSIINAMPSILIGISSDYCITLWNHEAEQAIGVSADKAYGQTVAQLFPQLSAYCEPIEEAFKSGQRSRVEKIILHWSEQSHYVDIIIYPLIANGHTSAVIRIDDITRRVQMEDFVIQSEKMTSISSLAVGIAHEINNPLAQIMQNTQVIENRLLTDLPKNREVAQQAGITLPQLCQYLEQREITPLLTGIRDAGGRTVKIIKSMLSFSRQSATMGLDNLADIAEEALTLANSDYDLKKYYHFRDFTIECYFASDLPLILCERIKLEQVILNILKNAAQAMCEVASLRQPVIQLHTYLQQDRVCLDIVDNGPGMSEEVQKQIFEPFYTTKAAGVGTGLGLSLAYFIVTEQHHGLLQVESVLGYGSCFTLSLPAQWT